MVSGNVQGVFYRANTRKFASEIGVKGYVRNLPTGDVEVVAEGRKNALDRLIEFCRKGPEGSEVRNIEIKWEKPSNEFGSFDVRV